MLSRRAFGIYNARVIKKLEKDNSLEVLKDGNIIFCDNGKWLHPLFHLMDHINELGDISNLILHDKIQGQAAAVLCIHMGFKNIEVDLISEKALKLYSRFTDIKVCCQKKVDRIYCMTEDVINEAMSFEDILAFVLQKKNNFK